MAPLDLVPLFLGLSLHAQDALAAAPERAAELALIAGVDEERAQETVRALVGFGPRMGGTASGRRAAEWLRARFVESGLEARVVADEEDWCHSESSWKLVARRDAGATARSGSPDPAEALVLARAWPWGFSPSASGRAALSLEGTTGAVLAASPPRYGRRDAKPELVLVDGVTTRDGSWPVVRALRSRDDNPYPVFGISRDEGAQLRGWLDAGREVEVEYELVATIERAAPSTVLASLPARAGAPPGYLLYCAHGDSDSGGPGANDNASGEAIVLEIARAFARAVRAGEVPAPPREVRFAVWGSEIRSTRTYLERRLEDGGPILAVVNFDQAGFGSGADQLNVEPDDLPANREFVLQLAALLRRFEGERGFPARWATNKSLGGTDSYVFSGSKPFRESGIPAVTLFTSAWGAPEEHPRTEGMPGESWGERDRVGVDYDDYYHSAGDLPELTTATEPWNMGWCARVGLLGGWLWLARLDG